MIHKAHQPPQSTTSTHHGLAVEPSISLAIREGREVMLEEVGEVEVGRQTVAFGGV